jgi:hypothetical protein
MTNSKFNLAAALGTLDRTALDKLLLESAAAGSLADVDDLLTAGADLATKDGAGRHAVALRRRQWPHRDG